MKILLGVTGGIAAYKSVELARQLIKSGHEVRCVLTQSAQDFVAPFALQTMTGHAVYSQLRDEYAQGGIGHIELARWPDRILVAPATANFMAKLAQGLADDLLSTLVLATQSPIYLAPAMNKQMWADAATQANVALLRVRGVQMIGPDAGEQACGEVGLGRMSQPESIVLAMNAGREWLGKKVLVTAGPTFEDLDPVRFIGNRSSGKMGYGMAQAFAQAGAQVTLISGPVALDVPAGVQRIWVRSAAQMKDAVKAQLNGQDVMVAAAAVADYTPATYADEKLKKAEGDLSIALKRTEDILAWVGTQPDKPFLVGFAAETSNVDGYARDKLTRKGLDCIIANQVGLAGKGFESDQNAVTLITANKQQVFASALKRDLAVQLVQEIYKLFEEKTA
jgi:phosphopantothenoylcysteine decarboxylase/phosphopantothenate--cysteine ligase